VNIILVGFPNSGKTSCGKLIAEQLKLTCVDTDELIVQAYGQASITKLSEVFGEIGEKSFRDLESRVILNLKPDASLVISTGGGAVTRDENKQALKDLGLVFYLTADRDLLYDRMQSTRVPAAIGSMDKFDHFFQARLKYYQAVADMQIETDNKTPETISNKIIQHWKQHGK